VAVLETSRIVALALYPVTPGLAARMHQQLGLEPLTPQVRRTMHLICHPTLCSMPGRWCGLLYVAGIHPQYGSLRKGFG
jgi:hypothetical protein